MVMEFGGQEGSAPLPPLPCPAVRRLPPYNRRFRCEPLSRCAKRSVCW